MYLILMLLMTTIQIQSTPNRSTIGKIEIFDKKMETLVDPNATIEIIANGLKWAEGPAWVKNDGYLLFSDPTRNIIYKWDEKDGMSEFLKPSGYTGVGNYSDEPGSNGLLINHEGELVACEHGDRRISSMRLHGGGKISIADKWQGKRFNSPNDICQHTNGTYYFTDPPYGLPDREKDTIHREITQNGVYSVTKDGIVSQVIADLDRPNGIALSEDEQILYVAQSDSKAPYIWAYDLQDGKISSEGRVIFDFKKDFPYGDAAPDGIKVDRSGNIYIGAGEGIVVISKEGKLLGRIYTSVRTANCAFDEEGYLYITASQYVFRVKMKI